MALVRTERTKIRLDISRHPCTVSPKMFHEVNCFSVVNRSEINPGLTPGLKALKAVLGPLRRYPRFNLSPSSPILRSPLLFSDTESSSSRCRLCAIVNEEADNVRSWTFYLSFFFLEGGGGRIRPALDRFGHVFDLSRK